jgi:shikimate 5-dehydrogenase
MRSCLGTSNPKRPELRAYGEGFVRGVLRKGRKLGNSRVLVAGNGGVGSALAASFAKAGAAELALFDAYAPMMHGLAERLKANYPRLKVTVGSNDPAGYDVVVDATPLGMKPDDPLPMDVTRIAGQARSPSLISC